AVVVVVAGAAVLLYRRSEAPAPPVPVAVRVPVKPAPAPVHVAPPIEKTEQRRPVVATAAPAPKAQPAAKPKAALPLSGKVKSIDRNWGFLVAEMSEPASLKVGDRLYAHLGDGRRV